MNVVYCGEIRFGSIAINLVTRILEIILYETPIQEIGR